MKFKIADINFQVSNIYRETEKFYKKYSISNDIKCETALSMTEADLIAEKSEDGFSEAYLEYIALCRKIAEWLPTKNAFLLHSACFEVDGCGVAFAAHSGTGKTTHMLLWQRLLGERLTVVNGDKPIIRYFDDEPRVPYAYGTPWNGKEHLGCNMRTQLRHICFIERSERNFCEPITKSEAINAIMTQVYMPKSPAAMAQTLALIDRLLSDCRLWKIHCNLEPEAAEVSYRAIFGEISRSDNLRPPCLKGAVEQSETGGYLNLQKA